MTQVLITRPEGPAHELAGRLQAKGLFPIVMPLYTFSALQPAGQLAATWLLAGRRKLAVFTSPRAVQYGFEHIPAEQLGEIEFAAIGNATRTRLEARGQEVHVQAATGFTSEDFLQVPELASKPGLAIIFCAPGGRETLALGLEAMGWEVIKAMVYKRVDLPPTEAHIEAVADADDLVTVWTSISALELARGQLPTETWQRILCTPALVISRRIQHHLERLGANHVELADGPGNDDLLHSILRLAGHQNDT